jgi:hypothetical protein
MTLQHEGLLSRSGIPDARLIIVRRRDDPRSIGTKGCAVHVIATASKGGNLSPTGRIPQPHSRAVSSSEAVITCLPSGLKLASLISSVCPLRAAISCPDTAFQMRAVLSPRVTRRRVPSRLNTAILIARLLSNCLRAAKLCSSA